MADPHLTAPAPLRPLYEVPAGAGALYEEIADCPRCPLARTRSRTVPGSGPLPSDLVFVGEGPGQREDELGLPFVGRSGQFLDELLASIGRSRRDVYVTNVVKCRPPKNRNPEPAEVEACRPFLEGQLAAIAPKLVLALGSVASRALFGDGAGITRTRGRWHEYAGIPAMPTFHPAYLLRRPEDKKYTFEDLKKLRERYDEVGGKR